MSNALFAFDNAASAQSVADRLVEAGLSRDAVQLHIHPARPGPTTPGTVDELITGGMVGNFRALFQNLFEWGSTPHDLEDHADLSERGAGVVGVEVRSQDERVRVEHLMAQVHPCRRTDWSDRIADSPSENSDHRVISSAVSLPEGGGR